MANKYSSIAELNTNNQDWKIKVLVTEKTPIRMLPWRKREQKLVAMDEWGNKIQCIIYDSDIDALENAFEIFHTYYIGKGIYKSITSTYGLLVDSQHHIVLNKNTYIWPAPSDEQLTIEGSYQLNSFEDCTRLLGQNNARANLLFAVVHCFPIRIVRVQNTSRRLQEFVIVNEEYKPKIMTLWEDFLENEGTFLTNNVHNHPIALAMRLGMTTFHGLTMKSQPNTVFIFNPPIPEAEHLQSWVTTNGDYIEQIITERLYEQQDESLPNPTQSQIRKISQILSINEPLRSFWIKANIKITTTDQKIYNWVCPSCAKTTGAEFDQKFRCFHCNTDQLKPKPRLRFEASLSDGTGILKATVEDKEAQALLGISAQDIVTQEQMGDFFSIKTANDTLSNIHECFNLRTYTQTYKEQPQHKYVVTSYRPSQREPSMSKSSNAQTSSSVEKRKATTSAQMEEDTESSEEMLKIHSHTREVDNQSESTFQHDSTSSTKRRTRSSKHQKQD